MRRAIDVATYLGAAIPINAVDGITAACLCIMQPARFKNCQEAARACGCSKTNCYKWRKLLRDKIQDEQANGAAGSSIVAGSTALSAQPTVEETLAEADSLAEAETIASLSFSWVTDRHPSNSTYGKSGSPAEIGRAFVHPTIATSHDPRLETRARPNAGHCPGDHADNPQAGRERCRSRRRRGPRCFARRSWSRFASVLPRPLSTGVRKDEWTASFEGDTFVRRCNFNWVDENGNDLPNTAATVALRKNGDLLRGRSAPSKCDRLNIE